MFTKALFSSWILLIPFSLFAQSSWDESSYSPETSTTMTDYIFATVHLQSYLQQGLRGNETYSIQMMVDPPQHPNQEQLPGPAEYWLLTKYSQQFNEWVPCGGVVRFNDPVLKRSRYLCVPRYYSDPQVIAAARRDWMVSIAKLEPFERTKANLFLMDLSSRLLQEIPPER